MVDQSDRIDAFLRDVHSRAPILGTPGYSIPSAAGLQFSPIDGSNDNWICATTTEGIDVRFGHGAHNNVIMLGEKAKLLGQIRVSGSNNIIIAGKSVWGPLNIWIWNSDSVLFLGEGTTFNSASISIQSAGDQIIVGDDCMGASGISLNETDMHAVIDMETDVWINHPRSVRVEPHVWFCKDVMVMKGVTVGMGAVLAARAVVTSDVPRWSIAAGVPAHVIRRGIVWDRQAQPTPGLVERLHGLEAQISPFAGMSRA